MDYRHPLLLIAAAAGLGCGAGPEAPEDRYQLGTSKTEQGVALIVLRDTVAGVEAAVAPTRGGELTSLRVEIDGRPVETIYRARNYTPTDRFEGRAPLLWPATGRSFPPDLEARRKAGESFDDGAWEHGGVRYPMPLHGFARDRRWTVESQTAEERYVRVVLSLGDDEETREMYPFGFELRATYTLVKGTLDIRYDVRADSENAGAMPFSIGNHIAFRTPLLRRTDPAEMTLIAPSEEELLKTPYGVPTGESRPRSHEAPVKLGDFEVRQAVSLTRFKGNHPMILLEDPGGLRILMSHNPSEWPERPVIEYNLWGDARDGYFSPEPWVGMQNSLVSGDGLIRLDPGESFDWTIHIELERF